MVLRLTLLFVTLMLFILGIIGCVNLDDDLYDIDEYPAMCVIGGIIWMTGYVIFLVNTCCQCGSEGARIGGSMIMVGITMFAEPFIHYLINEKLK